MRYKLEFFNGLFYAVPVDLDDIYWQRFKDGKMSLPYGVWACNETQTFTFEHPEITSQ